MSAEVKVNSTVQEEMQAVPRIWTAAHGGRTHSIRGFAKIKFLVEEEFRVQFQARVMPFEGGASVIMYEEFRHA